MKKYGLTGFPLEHSFSPRYFNNKFRTEGIAAKYELYPVSDPQQVVTLLRDNPEIAGLNVTIPHKERIIPYLNKLHDAAAEIYAVNTIRISRSEGLHLEGYNTDITGFEASLLPLLKGRPQMQALVLGTGGASKSIQYVLRKHSIPFRIVSRTPSEGMLTYPQLNEKIIGSSLLIINTTPLGMTPHQEAYPDLPYHAVSSNHICYDLIYNPQKTIFLRKAEKHGATIKNGLEMLEKQAEASWEIWNRK